MNSLRRLGIMDVRELGQIVPFFEVSDATFKGKCFIVASILATTRTSTAPSYPTH